MARRRPTGRFPALRQGQRRESMWVDIQATDVTLAAAGTQVLINVSNAALLALRPFTIVRTRGMWLVTSDQNVATESYFGNLGHAVVTEQAAAVGIGGIPTPATERESDLFFVLETWPGFFRFGSAVGFVTEGPREYDSRAMRKVNDDQDIVFVNGLLARTAALALLINTCVPAAANVTSVAAISIHIVDRR